MTAFAQARGEEHHAIVVLLDAVEPAAPPLLLEGPVGRLGRGVARQVGGRRPEPAVHGIDAAWQRVGHRDEPALLRRGDRQRHPDQIARLERRRRRTRAVLDEALLKCRTCLLEIEAASQIVAEPGQLAFVLIRR